MSLFACVSVWILQRRSLSRKLQYVKKIVGKSTTGNWTRKPSCRWQTRATLAISWHSLRNSSGVVSCIARFPIDSVPMVSYYVLDINCVCKMHRFGDNRLLKLPWPWNPGQGSLKVIESDTIQYPAYGFLLPFHSNFVCKMHRFRDMTKHWLKIVEKKPNPPHLARSFGVTPCEFFDESYLPRN